MCGTPGTKAGMGLPAVSAQRSLVGLAVLGEDGLRLLIEGGRHAIFLDHAIKLRLHGGAERIDVDLVERAALLLLELGLRLSKGGVGEVGQFIAPLVNSSWMMVRYSSGMLFQTLVLM